MATLHGLSGCAFSHCFAATCPMVNELGASRGWMCGASFSVGRMRVVTMGMPALCASLIAVVMRPASPVCRAMASTFFWIRVSTAARVFSLLAWPSIAMYLAPYIFCA